MSGQRTYYLANVPVDVDYYIEDGCAHFDGATINGEVLETDGLYIQVLDPVNTTPLLKAIKLISLTEWFQLKLDADEELMSDDRDGAICSAAEFRRG